MGEITLNGDVVRGALGWWLYAYETGDMEGGTEEHARAVLGEDADRLARLLPLRTNPIVIAIAEKSELAREIAERFPPEQTLQERIAGILDSYQFRGERIEALVCLFSDVVDEIKEEVPCG
jgi:hypothetical protein